jgi:hypothetical protein
MRFRAWKPEANVLESPETEIIDRAVAAAGAISILIIWLNVAEH